ncbi:hypothetical protein Pint_05201 [Pistacia integerrima]|uniref:Uncharacterized protein n=1 Tax=Pistacia integerrima TaxID=434235 RepID=A0ACC0Z7U4_9ROSI|nr:hypothetical protein Pint_05201 [Pistacia integerrima]
MLIFSSAKTDKSMLGVFRFLVMQP